MPIRKLAECLNYSLKRIDEKVIEELSEKAVKHFSSQEALKCGKTNYSAPEIFYLLEGLRKPEIQVFHDWIQSDQMLLNFLMHPEEDVEKEYSVSRYTGHVLEESFYSFLSTFLEPIIQKKISEAIQKGETKDLIDAFEFTQPLNTEVRIRIQQPAVNFIKASFQEISGPNSQVLSSDKGSRLLDSFTSPEFVRVLNLLDENFYSLRISYVDAVKRFFEAEELDERLKLGLMRALQSLDLNIAHRQQVKTFNFHQKERSRSKRKIFILNKALFRNPLTYIFIVVVLFITVMMLPFSGSEQTQKVANPTGLDSLTLDEIKTADSLLAFKEDSALRELEDLSVPTMVQDIFISVNPDLIKNETVKKLYSSMLNDYQIQQENNFYSDCNAVKKSEVMKFSYPGIASVENNENTNHLIINETDFDAYVLIFQNKNNGKARGIFLPSGGKTRLRLDASSNLIFYMGEKLTKFNPLLNENHGYGNVEDAKKIDESFTAHFCYMNVHTYRILSSIYRVRRIEAETRLRQEESGSIIIDSKALEALK
ncbi:MAG: hypothetical protein R3277_00500 [Brumimicrobium sp.]|nr:hypothetical protein [Brumimicrobium sp.]